MVGDIAEESVIPDIDAVRDVGTMPWQPDSIVADIPCITQSPSSTMGMSNRTAGREVRIATTLRPFPATISACTCRVRHRFTTRLRPRTPLRAASGAVGRAGDSRLGW